MPEKLERSLKAQVAGKNWSQERKDAYLAGIIDGEGCIAINTFLPKNGRSKRHTLTVSVNMLRNEAIDLLVERFGGLENYRVKDKRIGKIVREWRVENRKAYECIKALYPFLLVKKEEARTGINFYEETVGFTGQGKLSEKILDIREGFRDRLQTLKRIFYQYA